MSHHTDVLQAISSVEKVAQELSPDNGKTLQKTAKFDAQGLIAGHDYAVINHSGHYYWLVCGGRWISKDLFHL